ncbi:leucine-rich repeat-containing protein 40 isoform X2 [Scaptodrosophila lebanonensis]|uniref:Leucine-rich repeat-containing protein 40 isoform X2 n=1 Tax=Drosophila lebanonensis TaxID=7225 RepID=A0A6J2T1V4_DROLE|nr:leucine-rich repeat-containing protein 40 isoform X2 [Scaptodrosophila lebanonensis]
MIYEGNGNDILGTFNLSRECNGFGGDDALAPDSPGHPCFTHFGCPCDMNDNSPHECMPHTHMKAPQASRIPRTRPRVATRPNLSFLNPVFHERSQAEDDGVLSQQLWKLARKTGTLNLSNKGLARVPERIYDINEADADSQAANLEQLSIKEEDAWWNQVPLNNLDLSSNALTHISPKIENLQSLTVLILHDNALVTLPPEMAKLEKLVRLNLSHNKLSDLPRELYSLPELRHLNISYNEFSELDPDISDLHMLEFLDAGHNNIQIIPGGIGFLVRLTALLLPFNHIKELPPDLVSMRSLQKLDLMQNDLIYLPDDIGLLRKLQCLYIQHNDIKMLPDFEGSEELQELHASNNFIESVPKALCANLPHLKIFDLRDNKISILPDEICLLRNLHRLDVSNNSINTLPVTLSALAHLISLQVDGNPIKTIRRDILQCGTTRILKTLQERAQAKAREGGADNATAGAPGPDEALRLRGGQANEARNYPDKQQHYPCQCVQCRSHYQQQFQSSQQRFCNCPQCMYRQQQEASGYYRTVTNQYAQPDLAHYRTYNAYQNSSFASYQQQETDEQTDASLEVHPRWVYKLRQSRTLAVNLEELTDVPESVFQMAREENVHVVDFARNQLGTLPAGLQHLCHLVTELVLGHNLISHIPPFISQFTRITFIDLSNNLLKDLPSEIGVLNTLRELNIANNRLEFLPNGLYELQSLEVLIASDNHIKALNVSGLGAMRRLATLDLRNNDIDFVPPILGNLTNITRLELVGNPFRQPRHQILAKGTEAIMSYLRDRIPI